MTKFATTIAAAIFALTSTVAFAETPAPVTMKHKGVEYTYTVEATANSRIIRGTASDSAKPFVLYVNKRTVSGTVDGNDVSFPLRAVKKLTGIVEVAAR
ncbi:MAG: hypothetical protein ACKVOJ_10890 [Sphingomonadaceae bacterium]